MAPSLRRWLVVLWVAVAASGSGCGKTGSGAPPGTAIPRPDLTGAEAPVIEKINLATAAVRKSPRDAEAWGRLGVMLDAHGFTGEAVACYDHAAELAPGERRWPYLAGYALSLNDPAAAFERLDRAAAIAPRDVVILQILGDTLRRAGRDDEAARRYEQALALDGAARRAMLGLAELALRRDDLAAAADLLGRAASLNTCEREVHFKLARLATRRGDEKTASREAFFVRAYPEVAPFDDPLHQPVTSEQVSSKALSASGRHHAAEGRYALAEADFRAVLALQPADTPTRVSLAAALAYQGRADDAERLLRDALRAAPDDPDVHNNLGVVLQMRGDPARALEHLRRALELDGGNDEAAFNLGRLWAAQGRTDDAIAQWRAALALNPVNVPAHKALAALLTERGALDEAIGHWRDAIDLGCDDPEAGLRLGMIEAQRGRFAESVAILQRCLRRNGRDDGLASALATVLATCPDARFRDGRRAAALARGLLERNGPGHVPSLNLLAAALAESGDFAGAVVACERALSEAQRAGDQRLAAMIAARLDLYRRGLPFHQG